MVPMWAMLRRSLSSEAAASLITALTRAASGTGSFRPSNQTVASAVPPRSIAISRMSRAETMSEPIAALAIVLAITMRARSRASCGRSSVLVLVTNRASSRAMLMVSAPRLTAVPHHGEHLIGERGKLTMKPVTDVHELFRHQRAIRSFTNQDVPDELVHRALTAAIHGPSGSNTQPWHFIVIRDPAVKRAVSDAYEEARAAAYPGRSPAAAGHSQ